MTITLESTLKSREQYVKQGNYILVRSKSIVTGARPTSEVNSILLPPKHHVMPSADHNQQRSQAKDEQNVLILKMRLHPVLVLEPPPRVAHQTAPIFPARLRLRQLSFSRKLAFESCNLVQHCAGVDGGVPYEFVRPCIMRVPEIVRTLKPQDTMAMI